MIRETVPVLILLMALAMIRLPQASASSGDWVWIQRSVLFAARTELIKGIKTAFGDAGIEIPFPHRTVYFGSDKAAAD